MPNKAYSSKEVIKIIGITYRQLDYWDRSDFIKPSVTPAGGQGSERLYSYQDLVRLKVAKGLKDSGISLQKLRKSLEFLKANMPQEVNPLNELVFITDGNTLFVLTDNPNLMWDTLKGGQLAFTFNINSVVKELSKEIGTFDKPEPIQEKQVS